MPSSLAVTWCDWLDGPVCLSNIELCPYLSQQDTLAAHVTSGPGPAEAGCEDVCVK